TGQLIDSGQTCAQICDFLIQNMRDMMVLQSAGVDSKVLVLTDEEKQQLQQIAQSFDVAALVYNITALEKLRWTLRTSETNRALLEASLLRLTLSEHFIGLDRLSNQLAGGSTIGSSAKKKVRQRHRLRFLLTLNHFNRPGRRLPRSVPRRIRL
ncbi:MAG: hypothetical protein ACYS8S_05595, partial [Planctomycetota bacterium]